MYIKAEIGTKWCDIRMGGRRGKGYPKNRGSFNVVPTSIAIILCERNRRMCTAPHSLPHLVIRVFSSSCITGLGMPSEVLELLQQ